MKEDQWDNIVTCHNDSSTAYTWSSRKKTLGKHALKVTSPKQGNVTVSHIFDLPPNYLPFININF